MTDQQDKWGATCVRLHDGTVILPAAQRPDCPEVDQIRSFARERHIERLVHRTTMTNMRGVCKNGAILCVRLLRHNHIDYKPFDFDRRDQRINHVNLSITCYNFHTFYRDVKQGVKQVLLYVRPDYLWKDDTSYSPVNAATNSGLHLGFGFQALQDLFAPEVADHVGIQTREGKPTNLPTSVQAEVLVHRGIPLFDVLEAVVADGTDEKRLRGMGWHRPVAVDPESFRYRREWINKQR